MELALGFKLHISRLATDLHCTLFRRHETPLDVHALHSPTEHCPATLEAAIAAAFRGEVTAHALNWPVVSAPFCTRSVNAADGGNRLIHRVAWGVTSTASPDINLLVVTVLAADASKSTVQFPAVAITDTGI